MYSSSRVHFNYNSSGSWLQALRNTGFDSISRYFPNISDRAQQLFLGIEAAIGENMSLTEERLLAAIPNIRTNLVCNKFNLFLYKYETESHPWPSCDQRIVRTAQEYLIPLPRWAYINLIWGLCSLLLLSVYYTKKQSLLHCICIEMLTINN